MFYNAYYYEFFEKTIDKSASFDIIDSVPNELNIWGIAQLGERLNGIQEVSGSIPLISTKRKALKLNGFGAFDFLCTIIKHIFSNT